MSTTVHRPQPSPRKSPSTPNLRPIYMWGTRSHGTTNASLIARFACQEPASVYYQERKVRSISSLEIWPCARSVQTKIMEILKIKEHLRCGERNDSSLSIVQRA